MKYGTCGEVHNWAKKKLAGAKLGKETVQVFYGRCSPTAAHGWRLWIYISRLLLYKLMDCECLSDERLLGSHCLRTRVAVDVLLYACYMHVIN